MHVVLLLLLYTKKMTCRKENLRFVTWSSFIKSDFLADDNCGLGRSKSVLNQSYGLLCNGEVLSAHSGDLYNLANTHTAVVNTCVKTITQQHLLHVSVIHINIQLQIQKLHILHRTNTPFQWPFSQ